ncbi:MAG: V-type ATP synthase subunit D, partial [Kiritimatiellae bacterium]|nr:V-type ATP synthase subunit D [Kiritimatiellia bacterium]
ALKRFQRFLPMLQLKKQQLQAEIAVITGRLDSVSTRERDAIAEMDGWVALFADAESVMNDLVRVTGVETDTANIAGISVPVFKGIRTEVAEIDLFATPAWYDDAVAMVTKMLALKAERAVLTRQRDLITQELTTTSQRVNLFEKVKIPECKENIRVIKIAIGDEQTASVTRGKIAKGRGKKSDGEEAA